MLSKYQTVLLLLLPFCLQAQVSKWGKISQEEAEITTVSFEEEADAVVLFHTGKLYFVYGKSGHKIEYRKRIKILSEEGLDVANQAIYFYHHDNFERISRIKAQTINVEGPDEKEIIKVENSEIFKAEINDKYSAYKFTFPDVKVGSIIEYTYTLDSEGVTVIDAWRFQEEIPTLFSRFEAEIPGYLRYKILFQGRKLTRKYTTYSGESTWYLSNIPSIKKDEPYLHNHHDYYEKIRLQLEEYYNGSSVTKVSKGWEDFGTVLTENSIIRDYLATRKSKIKDEASLITNIGSDTEKAKLAFDHIISNYEWDGKYRVVPDKRFSEFHKDHKGSSGSLNLMLKAMLEAVGLSPEMVVISTVSNGVTFKESPFFTDFNHIILKVNLDGKDYFLDCTSGGRLPFGMLPVESNVKEGVLVSKGQGQWIPIETVDKGLDVVFARFEFENGHLRKDISWLMKDYSAEYYRKVLINNDSSALFDHIANIEGYQCLDFKAPNLMEPEEPLKLKVSYADPGENIEETDILYINTVLDETFNENPFKREERNFPVQFRIPPNLNQTVQVLLPEGFEAEELPEPVKMTLANGEVIFEYRCQKVQNSVSVSILYKVLKKEIQPRVYPDLRLFYAKMVEKCSEPIVLKRTDQGE